MKKIVVLVLTAFVLILSNSLAQTRVQVGDLYYNLSGATASVTHNRSYYTENDYTIVYRSNYRKSEYIIPSTINYNGYNYSVTSIEEGAFADQVKYKSNNTISYYNNLASPIKHITIPKSITHIGAYAFYNRYLDECNLPNVETIDEYAFACLSNFNTIIAPKLKKIGDYAFNDNRQLTELNFPRLETVGNYAFKGCSAITTISMPNLKQIGESSFISCTNLSNVSFPKLEVIGDQAFKSCNKLASVIFPETLTTMGENVFKDCSLLRELFYLSHTPPLNWVATTMTYVPDKQTYSLPQFSINNAQIFEIITFDSNAFNYTGKTPATTLKNNVIGYNHSITLNTININVGQHAEWIPVTLSKDEMSFTVEVVYRYTIKPIELTVKARNASRQYGEENPSFTCSYSGFVNGENESVFVLEPVASTSTTKTSDVGDYPITASGGSAKNYTFVYEPGTLTITKAPLSAKVNDETRQYGKENPAFTIIYTGLKNGEAVPAWTTAPVLQTEATKASRVGQYAIKAVNGVPVNYELEIADGTLSITPAPLTIKANDATRQYYNDNPVFSYKCNGFVNGDDESVLFSTPTLSATATRESNVGAYKINIGGASCSNYSISYINGTLTINPCVLTASVGNYERIYDEENPMFEVKYDGFVGNEDECVLNSKAIANTIATKTSDVGTYEITVSGGSANNYTFSYIPGILTINKAEQTIIWEQDLEQLKVGDQIELNATASSGLTVAYTSDNPNIAEVYAIGNKYYLDCKAEGLLWMVAVQDGNKNYYSSPRIRKKILIGDASAISANARAIARIEKTTFGIRVTDANIGEKIFVYTTGGQLIHSIKVDDHIIDIPLVKDGVFIVKVGGKTVKIGF